MNDHVELQQEDVSCALGSVDMNSIGQFQLNKVNVLEVSFICSL